MAEPDQENGTLSNINESDEDLEGDYENEDNEVGFFNPMLTHAST